MTEEFQWDLLSLQLLWLVHDAYVLRNQKKETVVFKEMQTPPFLAQEEVEENEAFPRQVK